MIQIWFGLIWIIYTILRIKSSKKQIKHKETQNTYLWFCDWLTWLAFGSSFESPPKLLEQILGIPKNLRPQDLLRTLGGS